MAYPMGEADKGALRLDFDRRLMLQFRGSTITSDAGLLAYRELDDALSLTDTGADTLADARTGKNGRHRLAGLLRQSVFGRLAGYEDVNDAARLCCDPAMRWVVGEKAITGYAASASQMGRFETKWLCRPENLVALADLPGQWIDKVRGRRAPKAIVLDMDSSESPTYGEQEGSAYNGHVWTTAPVQGKNGRSATWSGAVMCSASKDAVRMTAGHDEFRGSGPHHFAAQFVLCPHRVFPIPA
jgi:Transposase DDE domain group 1